MKRISPVAVLSVLVLAASEAPTSADKSMPIPPIPIAHRGLLRHAPENTLPAFAACLALGMGFELDIRTTKDGHLVALHDDNIQRTTNGPSRSVRDMTLTPHRCLKSTAVITCCFVEWKDDTNNRGSASPSARTFFTGSACRPVR